MILREDEGCYVHALSRRPRCCQRHSYLEDFQSLTGQQHWPAFATAHRYDGSRPRALHQPQFKQEVARHEDVRARMVGPAAW